MMLIDLRRRRTASATAGALAPLLLATTSLVTSAWADDLTVTNARTTSVTTSNVDGTGAGNLTVNSGASIAVGDPAAVTLDSSNTVNNAGAISTSVEQNATGVNIFTTRNGVANFLAGSVVNSGTIAAVGPSSTSSIVNNDVFNAGIRLSGLGSFTGSITNSGTIGVGGNASHGIWIAAPLIGDITNSGTIQTTGTNNVGIYTTAPVTGTIANSGTITGSGTGATGIYIGKNVSGGVLQSGVITVGQGPTRSTTDVDPKTGIGAIIPQVSSGPGVWLAGNVGEGMFLSGNSKTKAQEAADTSISTTGDSTITAIGGPALLVQPGGAGGYQNVVIGVRPDSPYSILSNANIFSTSSSDGVGAIAVDIKGAVNGGTSYTASLPGGFANIGGDISASAVNASAIAFHVGAGGSVKEFYNTGDISVLTNDDTAANNRGLVGTKGGTAYGVLVDQGGVLTSFTNTGNLTVKSTGPNSSLGVVDLSGSIKTFLNSGKITPTIDALSPGSITAVDLRANTTGVNFTNNGTGIITGPVYLGSGTNTFTMDTAQQNGNVSFVGGTNTLSIKTSTVTGNIALGNSNSTMSLVNSTINGGLGFTTGSLTLNVSQNSTINTPSGQVLKVTNASFDATSVLKMGLTGTQTGNGTLVGTGNVSFANGAKIVPVFTGIAATQQTVNLVTSGNLTLGSTVASLVQPNVSFVNSYTTQLDPTNPNNIQLTVRRRTTGEMGLNPNMAAAFNGAVNALNKDPDVAAAVLAPATRDSFLAAFRQLLPDTSDATRQIATAAQNLSLGAVRSRLTGIPDLRAGRDGDRSSIWLQAIGTGLSAKADGDDLGYGDWGVGIALGADTPLSATTKVGVNITEMFNSVDFGVSPNSQLFIYGSQLNVYARQDLGRFYVQGLVGGGLNHYEGTRNIRIGTLKRTADGRGNGYQVGGTIELGTQIGLGSYSLDPYVRAQYLKLHQGLYQDTGGGDGVNLTVDAHDQTSLKGSTGFAVNRDYVVGIDSTLQATLRGNYSHEFKDAQNVFNSRFTSDSTPFTNSILLHGPNYYSAGFSVGHKDSFSSITLDYDGEATGKFVAHTATINLRFRL